MLSGGAAGQSGRTLPHILDRSMSVFSCSTRPRFRPLLAALGLALLGPACIPHPADAQTAVLTQNNDNGRTGANTAEATLTPAAVSGGHFGRLFTISSLNANVNGQVLYAPRVAVGDVTRNLLIAYTSNNTDHSPCGLFAFDADTGGPVWAATLPNSATYTTAAPVIDQTTNTIYVLTKTDNDDTGQTYLRAFDLAEGLEKPGSPIQVQASAAGTGDGSVIGHVFFDGPASSGRFHANDRAALLLLNGVVYTSFAHNTDSFPYHGWILGYHYDGTKFTQTAVFCTTPNGGDGGIWQAGKGLTADANGFIYCSVGNGTFDANTGGPDYGMCFLKLRASDLSVVDWFAPHDESTLSNEDLDLGNIGVVALPGTDRLFGGGTKFGSGFVLDSTNLGKFTPNGPDKCVQRLDGITGNDSVGQNPIAWASSSGTFVYLWAYGSQLQQFKLDSNTGAFSPAGPYKETSGLTHGGSLAVSAAGTGGGVLWTVGSDSVVRAFDATDVSKPALWTSAGNSSRDALPSVGHFQFPTVVNGKVYVPTNAHSIVVYGMLTPATSHTHLLWNDTNGRVALWNVAGDGTVGVQGFGPYSGDAPGSVWHATDLATGPDGLSHLLWNNTDGRVALWTVDNGGGVSATGFGPFTDGGTWRATAVSVGPDNVTHLLWNNPTGHVALWNVDSSFNATVSGFGPYNDNGQGLWSATALATGPDNVSRIAWNNPDGRVALWTVDAAFNSAITAGYGPYTDGAAANKWSAAGVSVGPDNLMHLLWSNTDGKAAFWNVAGDGTTTVTGYGPYTDTGGSLWTASGLATGPDGVSHLLWDNTDYRAALWAVDNSFNVTVAGYGPYADSGQWSATAVSAGP